MSDTPYNVLFLCTQNSTRSIIAEVLMNSLGQGAFKAYSAGSQPRGQVNPLAIEILKNHNHKTDGLRSKSWDEFSKAGAAEMDFVFTLCDDAAKDSCPILPGKAATDHWGMMDPSMVEGSDSKKLAAYANTYSLLHHHISKLLDLAKSDLDEKSMRNRVANLSAEIREENQAKPLEIA